MMDVIVQGQDAGGGGRVAANRASNKYSGISRLRDRVLNKLNEPERRKLLIEDFETNPPKPLQVVENSTLEEGRFTTLCSVA